MSQTLCVSVSVRTSELSFFMTVNYARKLLTKLTPKSLNFQIRPQKKASLVLPRVRERRVEPGQDSGVKLIKLLLFLTDAPGKAKTFLLSTNASTKYLSMDKV